MSASDNHDGQGGPEENRERKEAPRDPQITSGRDNGGNGDDDEKCGDVATQRLIPMDPCQCRLPTNGLPAGETLCTGTVSSSSSFFESALPNATTSTTTTTWTQTKKQVQQPGKIEDNHHEDNLLLIQQEFCNDSHGLCVTEHWEIKNNNTDSKLSLSLSHSSATWNQQNCQSCDLLGEDDATSLCGGNKNSSSVMGYLADCGGKGDDGENSFLLCFVISTTTTEAITATATAVQWHLLAGSDVDSPPTPKPSSSGILFCTLVSVLMLYAVVALALPNYYRLRIAAGRLWRRRPHKRSLYKSVAMVDSSRPPQQHDEESDRLTTAKPPPAEIAFV